MRRVRRGSIFSELLMCGGVFCYCLLMPRDNRCMYMAQVCLYVCCSNCVGVCGNVCCVADSIKDSLKAVCMEVMGPALEYASSIWLPFASSNSINKLQVMQNAALRTATGCTQDTNIQHLHDETLTLPIHEHLQLHASQYKQNTTSITSPTQTHNILQHTKAKKKTIFNNGRYTTNIPTDPHTVTTTDIKTNMRHIYIIYCL